MTIDQTLILLSDPTRRALYEQIARGGEVAVLQLVETTHVSQPAVSQHLKKLQAAGLVSERRAGRRILYKTCPEALNSLHNWLEEYQNFWPEKMQALRNLLDEMPDDPKGKQK